MQELALVGTVANTNDDLEDKREAGEYCDDALRRLPRTADSVGRHTLGYLSRQSMIYGGYAATQVRPSKPPRGTTSV